MPRIEAAADPGPLIWHKQRIGDPAESELLDLELAHNLTQLLEGAIAEHAAQLQAAKTTVDVIHREYLGAQAEHRKALETLGVVVNAARHQYQETDETIAYVASIRAAKERLDAARNWQHRLEIELDDMRLAHRHAARRLPQALAWMDKHIALIGGRREATAAAIKEELKRQREAGQRGTFVVAEQGRPR